jgi:predicted nuclease of predicted toxin-antitoxin system
MKTGASSLQWQILMPEPRLFAALYIDEDITDRLAVALRQRGYEAVAAHEAGLVAATDEHHLLYATERQMILLTSNRDDFLQLARTWAMAERVHYEIGIAPQFSRRQFGELLRLVINLLDRTAEDELTNTVCYLTAYR